MSVNPKDWFDVAERIFNSAVGYGIVVSILTGTYVAAYRNELVSPTYVTTLAFDVSQVILVFSIALLIVGLVVSISIASFRIAMWPLDLLAGYFKNRAERDRLLSNYYLLSRESQIVFLSFLNHDRGRFRSPGDVYFVRELIELGFIHSEDPASRAFEISHAGELMNVVPLLNTKAVRRKVEEHLNGEGVPVTDKEQFEQQLRKIALGARMRA